MCSLHLTSLKHVLPQTRFPRAEEAGMPDEIPLFYSPSRTFLEAVLPAQAAQIEATEDPPLPYGTC